MNFNDVEPFIPLIISLVFLLMIYSHIKRGDPISRFARASFKMKLDKKTGRFWAKSKHGIDPPFICPECHLRPDCNYGTYMPGYMLVDCPEFERENGK